MTEEPPTKNLFQKGVDGQKTKQKWNFEKEEKGKPGKKTEKEEKKHFKTGLLGNKIDKKPLKLQENSLLGPFYKTQAQKHRQQKNKTTKTQQTYPKKTFLHFGKQPLFLVNLFFFFKLHSFMSTKLCFAENTIKIVFSTEHGFCVSQIVKPPFRGKPKMALLQPEVPFWVFPRACWNPYFCSVWWLWMGTKKGPFSQNR